MESDKKYDANGSEKDPLVPNPNHTAAVTSSETPPPAPKCTIHLTSYGHHYGPLTAPPINPAHTMDSTPQLFQYDIRALPNPPKNIRTQYTGMHKPSANGSLPAPRWSMLLLRSAAYTPREVHVNSVLRDGEASELGRRPFFIAQERKHRDIARAKHNPRSHRQRPDRTEG
ncbi:hypothetical protein C8J57DRAFT_1356408 [Mycena rebaudengoi]|nr:hypothetical protein C8J57DRAFT_1356408 [Mycena rebaudengoi]